MDIIIGKPIEGLSLNGLEYLMGDDSKTLKTFPNKKLAVNFLREYEGCETWTDEEIDDYFMFEEDVPE